MALPVYTTGYQPAAAGAITPAKYTSMGLPTPGKNYMIWGEQSGYVYNPYTDHYDVDSTVAKKYGQSTGLIAADPKQASLTDTLGPLAAVSAVSAAVPSLVKEGIGLLHPATAASNVGNGAAMASQGAEQAAMANLGSLGGGAGAGVAQGGTAAGEQALLDSSFLGETGAEAGAGTGTSTLAAAAPYAGLVGMGLGAKGVYDAANMSNKRSGVTSGLLSGAGMGLGAGMAAPLLLGTGPLGWGTLGLMALGGGLLGGGTGLMAHESTDDRTKRRYGELEKTDNQTFEAMKQKGLEWSLSGDDTWDIGDDKSAAPIDNMVNSYGVLKTFGTDWTNYSAEQQHNIVQGLVNADKINSKQGEYLIDDPEGAKEIAQSIAGAPAGATTTASTGSSGSSTTTTTTTESDIMPGLLTTPGARTKSKKTTGDDIRRTAEVVPIAIAVSPGGLIR